MGATDAKERANHASSRASAAEGPWGGLRAGATPGTTRSTVLEASCKRIQLALICRCAALAVASAVDSEAVGARDVAEAVVERCVERMEAVPTGE